MSERDSDIAVDTSVAVPYVMESHVAHATVVDGLRRTRPRLTGHSLAETYSVLTRLPGDARLGPAEARRLIDANFGTAVLADPETLARVHDEVARLKIGGGAVYDALVALAARTHRLRLATRDVRAQGTYALLGVETVILE